MSKVTQPTGQKVTLTDLLSVISFITPICGGIVEGFKSGIVGVLLGFAVGLWLGIGCFLGFRKVVRFLAKMEMERPRIAITLFFMNVIIFVFLPQMVAMAATTAIAHQGAIPVWGMVFLAILSLIASFAFIRSGIRQRRS